MTPSIRKKT